MAAIFGAWVVLSGWMRTANSDGLIPVFEGLYRWTPFYWGAGRYGMPVALLLTPIDRPILALALFYLIGHALFVLFWVALAAFTIGRERALPAGLSAAAFALLVLDPALIAFYCQLQAYVQSAAVGTAGLVWLDRAGGRGKWSALLFFAVSFWIAPTSVFWILPLFVARELARTGRGGIGERLLAALPGASLIALTALVVTPLGKLVPAVQQTPLALARPEEWPGVWKELAAGLWRRQPHPWLLAFLVLASMLGGILLVRRHRGADPSAIAATSARSGLGPLLVPGLLCAAIVNLLASGTLSWVAQAAFSPVGWRYATMSHLLVVAIPSLVGWALVSPRPSARQKLQWTAISVLMFLSVVTWRYGWPSIERARLSLRIAGNQNRPLDPAAHELLDHGATHLLGDYWRVYPMIFRANSIAYEREEKRVVWPITERAEAIRDLWFVEDWRKARIAVLKGDPTMALMVSTFGLPPLELVERGRYLDIFRGAQPSLPAPRAAP